MRFASLLIAVAMTFNASPINAQAEDQGGPQLTTELALSLPLHPKVWSLALRTRFRGRSRHA